MVIMSISEAGGYLHIWLSLDPFHNLLLYSWEQTDGLNKIVFILSNTSTYSQLCWLIFIQSVLIPFGFVVRVNLPTTFWWNLSTMTYNIAIVQPILSFHYTFTDFYIYSDFW